MGVRNTFYDLHTILMAEVERLDVLDAEIDDVRAECSRAKALANTARMAIENGRLLLEARRVSLDVLGEAYTPTPRIFLENNN